MNIKQYEYILAVAELKNFGQAADKCFIGQSTLSTMIGKFEDEIGIKIFDRKTKPVTITKEGEEIIQQIKVINKEIELFGEVVQNIKGDMIGEVKIGVIPTIAPYLLPLFLNNFVKKFPKINFIISEITTPVIIELLEKREIDIGIFAIPIGNDKIEEITLYKEPFLLYNNHDTPLQTVANFESIDYNNFWLLAEGHCLHTQVNAICKMKRSELNSNINFEFKSGSIESLVRFVKSNNGITLLPYLACLEFDEVERKKLNSFQSPIPVREIGIGVHKHYAKKKLLVELKKDIQKIILPLINFKEDSFVVAPI